MNAELEELTSDEVAALLKVTRKTVEYWRQHGKGPTWRKYGNGAIRYRMSDVRAFMDSAQVRRSTSEHLANA